VPLYQVTYPPETLRSDYQRRVLDDVLDDLQPHLKATSIFGPKGVGKTATAARRAKTIIKLDDEFERLRLSADPSLLNTLPGPVLIDEWQRWPESWDQIRRAVDDFGERGRFLITGSSAPRGATTHSGAGRITGFRLRPMSLFERGVTEPTVSLGGLLSGEAEISGETNFRLDDYAYEITASGFPGIRTEPTERLRKVALDAYLQNVVQREFTEQGYSVRKPEMLQAWLAAYAAASSTTAKYVEILDAATPNEADKPSSKTTVAYRDALSALWLLDPTPAWIPTNNPLKRLGQASKHQLADPALSARLLGLDSNALLAGAAGPDGVNPGPLLGALFESLATLDMQVYAGQSDAQVSHYRDQDGRREIDLIVTGENNSTVAFEVKLSAKPTDADVRHLLWLREQLGDRLTDAAVITTGPYAYRRKDGIAVIPLALLGP